MGSPKNVASRTIKLGNVPEGEFEPNYISYQRNNMLMFVPRVVFNHCSLYIVCSWIVRALASYIKNIHLPYEYYHYPLAVTFTVSFIKEGIETYRRYRAEKQFNNECCQRVVLSSGRSDRKRREEEFKTELFPAAELRVGDIVVLHRDQRVPADMILLKTNETSGTVLLKTDEVDGDINLKIRKPTALTQTLTSVADLLTIKTEIFVDKPNDDIHSFIGSCKQQGEDARYNRVFASALGADTTDPIDVNNTMWCGSVLASDHAIGLVIYTGRHTRTMLSARNVASDNYRYSQIDSHLDKYLFFASLLINISLAVSNKLIGGYPLYGYLVRFVPMLTLIVPISLRVNLDIAKLVNTWLIQSDNRIPGAVVRSTFNVEDLGNVEYMLVNKTGTLTNKQRAVVALRLRTGVHLNEHFAEVKNRLRELYVGTVSLTNEVDSSLEEWEAVLAMGLCHEVTPVHALNEAGDSIQQPCQYRGASADEKALLEWVDMMGVTLHKRNSDMISLKIRESNTVLYYKILQIFPYDNETKLMGIIVQEEFSGVIIHYLKGAKEAMPTSKWLQTECDQMTASGLRTLVFAKKKLTTPQYRHFEKEYVAAKSNCKYDAMSLVLAKFREETSAIAVAGVEDCVHSDVPETLDILQKAGIKVWMVTGDDVDTALCTARRVKLGGDVEWRVIRAVDDRRDALLQLEALRLSRDQAVAIDACALDRGFGFYEEEWLVALCAVGCVVVARCWARHKARLASRLRAAGRGVAGVGRARGDVALLLEADLGIGIENPHSMEAALASDVSVTSFSHVAPLLLQHGRRCAATSYRYCFLILQRGIFVFALQALFAFCFRMNCSPMYDYIGPCVVCCIYVMMPSVSLVLDDAASSSAELADPYLYQQNIEERKRFRKTFALWSAFSLCQGGVVMWWSLLLYRAQYWDLVHIIGSAVSLVGAAMLLLFVRRPRPLAIAVDVLMLAIVLTAVMSYSAQDTDNCLYVDESDSNDVISCRDL